MNKSDLKKLSNSLLINLLLKQKPKVQKKPKVAYNLENLFNDDVFPSDPHNKKMKKVKKMKKELDQQTVQIDDFRQDEIQISKDKNKAQRDLLSYLKQD